MTKTRILVRLMFKGISYNRIRQGHRLFVVVLVFASIICFVNLQFGAISLPSVTTPLYDLQETENASTDSNVEDPVPQPSPLITSSSIESTENLKDPIQQSSSLITNNYMEYPRLPPAPLETLHTLRRLHLQKLQAIIEDPLPKSASEHWNIEQLKGLVHYWNNEVGPNGKLQQPKVILTSDGNVPCAISLCSTTDEVVWLGSLVWP
ncbi:hypothetical protein BT96DRAFT_346211 [Gymnopus androsaceus JB14]|uniref:Uncharacterized protein n=1 Tax=Gymnopus androsaceus JB14 TaxID=1447944 RepID=A0A6A4I848_9AGAR|nr:hypothetical protein BT96DRAFT_346211 [Gymnopus androsaceus JB14]